MPSVQTKKLNLPLSDETHRALFDEARRSGVPATRLARSAIEEWLQERERERRREEIRRFAVEHAGGEYDLDPALEAVAAEEVLKYDGADNETR